MHRYDYQKEPRKTFKRSNVACIIFYMVRVSSIEKKCRLERVACISLLPESKTEQLKSYKASHFQNRHDIPLPHLHFLVRFSVPPFFGFSLFLRANLIEWLACDRSEVDDPRSSPATVSDFPVIGEWPVTTHMLS